MSPSDRPRSDAANDASLAPQDAQAVARYRYLVKTAPPESIELAHAEAFARLSPAQRQVLLQQIAAELPPHERALASPANAGPHGLARLITRTELRRPGSIERLLGGRGAGLGMMLGTTLLGTIAGSVIGTAIAQQFFAADPLAATDTLAAAAPLPDVAAADGADGAAEFTDAADFAGDDAFDIGGFDI